MVTTSKPKPEPEWLKEFKGKRGGKKEHATVCHECRARALQRFLRLCVSLTVTVSASASASASVRVIFVSFFV